MMGMRKTDLGELYALIKMYQTVYGGVPEELIASVGEAYGKAAGPEGNAGGLVTNPRGAGRKSRRTPERIRQAKELQRKGCKIRDIAKEMGCSVGTVHKLINEQTDG